MLADVILGLRWVLGLVFVTAGVLKLRVGRSFAQSIASYAIVPPFLHGPIARSLPIVELCLGGACMLGVLPIVAGWTACLMLLAFAGAVGWNLARGHQFDCGCGMTPGTAISWGLAVRDLALAAIAATIALGPSGSLALWRGSSALPSHLLANSQLIPIPMIVILMLCVIRALAESRPLRTHPHRPERSSDQTCARLSIVHATTGARRTAQAG